MSVRTLSAAAGLLLFLAAGIVKASTYVDLSLGYALTPHLTLNFDAINLTKERYESYLGDPIRPRDIRYNPTAYGLSLRYQM